MRLPLLFNIAYWMIVIGGTGFFLILLYAFSMGLVTATLYRRRLSDAFVVRTMNIGIVFGRLILAGLAVAAIRGAILQTLL